MGKQESMKIFYDRKTQDFVGLSPDIIEGLSEAYPGVPINRELERMKLWLSGHKRKGSITFIMNWLARCPKAEPTNQPTDQYKAYLERLWQNCEHLFSINMKH